MAQKYTRSVATNMVIANMIGTGIFTALGFQVIDTGIPDAFSILVIWTLGGLVALCGATVYGEVATRVNKSGGEYAFLSHIYHPLLGFISGWISLIVGFSAAIAALALAAGEYFLPVLGFSKESGLDLSFTFMPYSKVVALFILGLVAMIHLQGVKMGGIFQNLMTYVKLGLILVFLVIPFLFLGDYEPSGVRFAPTDKTNDTIFSLSFAGALAWVMFAYSGWNASTYIVRSLENPKRNLPFSLLVGTLIVTVIYILLNFVFMYVASFDELAFQVDLGNVVANKILGDNVGLIFSMVFSLALISGVSAMFIAGPRVAEEIGKDYKLFAQLGNQTRGGTPKYGILFILLVSALLVVFSNFEDIIQYISLTLIIFSTLTVMGVFILRHREKKTGETTPDHVVKSIAYPIAPIIFIAICLWMIGYFAGNDYMYLLWSLGTMVPAVVIYYVSKNNDSDNSSPSSDNG